MINIVYFYNKNFNNSVLMMGRVMKKNLLFAHVKKAKRSSMLTSAFDIVALLTCSLLSLYIRNSNTSVTQSSLIGGQSILCLI